MNELKIGQFDISKLDSFIDWTSTDSNENTHSWRYENMGVIYWLKTDL